TTKRVLPVPPACAVIEGNDDPVVSASSIVTVKLPPGLPSVHEKVPESGTEFVAVAEDGVPILPYGREKTALNGRHSAVGSQSRSCALGETLERLSVNVKGDAKGAMPLVP